MTVPAMASAGDLRDRRRLVELEGVIEGGLRTFIEVGEALIEIRGSRLYRLSHDTFEAYCRDRWGFSRQRASQLVDAAQVVRALPDLSTNVANEGQARALAPVVREHGPEVATEVWRETNDRTNGQPTARVIREVAAEVIEGVKPPIDAEQWTALARLMETLEAFASSDASIVAAAVPLRRRDATARRLRKLGTYLGRIAWTLEGRSDQE